MNTVLAKVRRGLGLLLLGVALAPAVQADTNGMDPDLGMNPWGAPQGAIPGDYYLEQGQKAFSRGQLARAHEMFLAAASWGQKIAQYNLGLMSFKGVGVPVDRIEGRAWLSLAAERGDDPLVAAREWADVQLTPGQRTQANVRLETLAQKYADAAALPRAKARFVSATGSNAGPYHALSARDLVALEK